MPLGDNATRRGVLTAIGVGSLAGLAGCLTEGDATGGGEWPIGTSSEGTMAYAAGTAYAETINEHTDISSHAETTGGTASNPALAAEEQIVAGTTTSPVVRAANEHLPPYRDGFEREMYWTQLWVSHTLDFHLVRLDNQELEGMETIHDLPEDIDISFGQAAGTQFEVTMEVLEVTGIEDPRNHFENIHDIDVASQAEALREERIDVAMPYTTNLSGKVGWVQELDSTVDLQFVNFDVDPEEVEQTEIPVELSELDPDLYEQEMDYPGEALVTPYNLCVPHWIDDQEVYDVMEACMGNYEEVRGFHEDLEFFGPEYSSENLLATESGPVHPGAEEWYRENDWWHDDLTSFEEFEENVAN